MEETLLQIKNLEIAFRQNNTLNTVIKGISFDIGLNETVGVVGESGSGKSVSSLALLGLLPKRTSVIKGEILFNSSGQGLTNIVQCNDEQLLQLRGAEISMIFQEPMTALNPVMRCGKQVMENITTHHHVSIHEAREKVIRLFEEVQLPDPQRAFLAYPHELSGGQRQRVMIAIALAGNPKLLICDEPTTALDVTTQAQVITLLKKIQQERNMSMIFISHDLQLVSHIADKIIVMYKGEIVEQNSAASIFNSPQHAYTKALLNCRPQNNYMMERLPTLDDFMETGQEKAMSKNFVVGIDTNKPVSKARTLTSILILSHIKKFYKERKGFFKRSAKITKSVNDVSLDVYKGECLGLVGESGCGKSTLSRIALRLLEPTSGRVLFEGIDLTELKGNKLKAFRKKIQIIFQDPYSALNPNHSIGYILTEPMLVHKIYRKNEVKEQAELLLEKVGLPRSFFHRYPHELSGGQRQRICIARALALKPEFIICDESVSALDVSIQAQVLNLLKDLQEEFGLTYIFITHDLNVVRFMADRIAVMQKGEIVELNETEQLFHAAQNDYTKILLQSSIVA